MVRFEAHLPHNEDALQQWLVDIQKAKNSGESRGSGAPRLILRKKQLVYDRLQAREYIKDAIGSIKTNFKEIVSFCAEHGLVSIGLTQQIEAYNVGKKGAERIDATTLATIKIYEAVKMRKPQLLAEIESQNYLLAPLRNAIRLGRADVVKAIITAVGKGAIRIGYDDLKACSKAKLKEMLGALNGLATVGTIVREAVTYQDLALLKLMQHEGVVDEVNNSMGHLICSMKPTFFTEGFFPTILAGATKEQLNAKNDSDETIFELAYLKGHVSCVQKLIESEKVDLFAIGGYTRQRALHKLCYLSAESKPKKMHQHDEIAKKLIKAASRENLLLKSSGKTVLELACQNNQQAIIEAVVERLVQTIQATDHTELWWNELLKLELPASAVELIVAGFQKAVPKQGLVAQHLKTMQAICEQYDALKAKDLASLDALRCAFVLEKNMPKGALACELNLNLFKHDLVHAKLSAEAVHQILKELSCARITRPTQEELQIIIEQYKEISKGVKSAHLRVQEALATAIIVAHDIPKVEAVKQKVLQGAGYLALEGRVLPEGWKLFKDQGRLSVITGHKLGEGTFKKAHTTVLFTLAAEVASKPIPAVHLLTERTQNQREERQHEIEVSLELNSSPSVIRTHTARLEIEGQLNQLGMIVEMGESDLEHALNDVEERALPQVLERLEIFQDIVSGLCDMHARHIVHGDMKVANCYVTRDEAGKKRGKISDFGTAVFTKRALPAWSPYKQRAYGSPSNTPPELCFSKVRIENVDLKKTDIWACAMTLKAIYSGKKMEFSWAEDLDQIDQATFKARLKKELLDPLENFKKLEATGALSLQDKAQYKVFLLLEKMMKEDPDERLDADELLAEVKSLIAEIRSLI